MGREILCQHHLETICTLPPFGCRCAHIALAAAITLVVKRAVPCTSKQEQPRATKETHLPIVAFVEEEITAPRSLRARPW
jgi:hypothetical protein